MGKNKARKKNARKKTVYQCEVCNGTQEDPVVACDICDKWHHFKCVGIKSIGKKDAWFCNKCKPNNIHPSSTSQQASSEAVSPQKEKLTSPSNNRNTGNDYDLIYDHSHPYHRANQPTSPAASVSSNHQVNTIPNRPVDNAKSNSSRASNFSHATSQRQRVELEIIEEERILHGERDRQYLEQKYRFLMQRTNTKRSSEASYINRGTDVSECGGFSNTENWIKQVTKAKSMTVNPGKAITTSSVSCEFLKELTALTFKSPHPHDDKTQRPTTYRNPPDIERMKTLYCCGVCDMVGDVKIFGACLLCSMKYHFACMDIITIDNDTFYICPNCKISTGRTQQNSAVKPCQLNEAQTECTNPTKQTEQHQHQCGICGLMNNQQRFQPCQVCDKLFHNSCMTTTLMDNKNVWICPECNESKQFHRSSYHVPSINEEVNPFRIQSNICEVPESRIQTSTAKAIKPSPGLKKLLTSEQIASRHVVTRDLPIFTGKPEQWPMFISRFNNSTELCEYSNSENLDRLQKCLKGNAYTAVSSRLLTAESVPGIMSTLRMLYGRPELVVNSLMNIIRAEPPPKADKLNTLVDFALSVKNVCATLEQAKLEDHLSNPSLMRELVDKLPSNIKIEWAKHKATIQNVNLSTLSITVGVKSSTSNTICLLASTISYYQYTNTNTTKCSRHQCVNTILKLLNCPNTSIKPKACFFNFDSPTQQLDEQRNGNELHTYGRMHFMQEMVALSLP